MIMQSAGILSLAVRFPQTIRSNQYWLQNFPELFVHATPRQRERQTRIPKPVELDPTTNGIDLWLQEAMPYLADPFRGSVDRRVVSDDETSLLLEFHAAEEAIAAAKLSANQIDLAIVTSLFPDTVGTGLAAHLAQKLGLNCPAWNLESTCASALIALHTAQAFLQSGIYQHILIVVSHIGSQAVNESDTLSWSMGDGAGAFIVGKAKPNQGILSTKIMPTTATCGAYVHELVINDQGKPRIQTSTGENVSSLATTAVDQVCQCCLEAVKEAGVRLDLIDYFAFNTPTAWYASVCAQALGIDPERIINLYPIYANIGPVFPIANLYHAAANGKIRENDLVLVYANGASATAAAMVIRWGDTALGSSAPDNFVLTQSKTPIPVEIKIPSKNNGQAIALSEIKSEIKSDIQEKLFTANLGDRHAILVTYLLEWLANLQQLTVADLSSDEYLATMLDSLMAIIFRRQIEMDLQICVPMEQFFGDITIHHLADFLLNQLAIAKVIHTEDISVASTNQIAREVISL